MGTIAAASELVARLPDLSRVGIAVEIRDGEGRTVGGLHRGDAPGPAPVELALDGGARLLLHLPAEGALDLLRPLIEELARAAAGLARLEGDMESMSRSSLALLEQVAMVDELVGRLPSCRDDEEVVRVGLEHLVVAISARWASYIAWDEVSGRCRVQVEVRADAAAGPAGRSGRPFDPAVSLVGDLLHGGRDEVLEQVPRGARLGVPGLPEHEAERQFLAVPVRLGDGSGGATVGVLAVADKQPNSYNSGDRLGSHEAKLVATLGRLIGSALGSRSVAAVSKELKLARDIQQQILPSAAPRIEGFDLAGRCATSNAVGGDYYDFVPMADGRTLALVADVSGHNLASGMLMVAARSALRLLAGQSEDPGAVFSGLGDALHDDLARTERFISAAGVVLHRGRQAVEVVNAGHVDVLLRRASSGRVERLPSTDAVFGFLPGVRYAPVEVVLEPGDALLLYTDGVVEAQAPGGEMFGDARLETLFREVGRAPAPVTLDAVFAAVADFTQGDARADDVTVMVVRRELRPRPEGRSR
jgi:hypothetical protein